MSSPDFKSIIDDALDKYHEQTGTDLRDTKSPFADKLKDCKSPGEILTLLQKKEKDFNNFRDKYRKVIDSLKPIVQLLHAISGTLGEAVSLVPFTPAKAIFVGIDVLLTASFGVSTSYDALVDLFVSIECFLKRLDIYTEVKPTLAMKEIAVKIMVEVLSTIALATKQIKQGRLRTFGKKLLGDNDVDAVLKRLERLTREEARATMAQTLEIVHGLVGNMNVIMDDGRASADDVRKALVIMQELANEVNEAKHRQLLKDVRSWLSPPDPWKNYHIARKAYRNGTPTWFIKGDTYTDWMSYGSLLWIFGKPGSGKSVLCSSIIQDLESMTMVGFASIAIFYCDFRDTKKQNRCDLLSSLLVQLCEQSDTYCSILSKFYSAHRDGSRSPSDDELTECLFEMLQQEGQAPIYITVDGLDECPNTSGIPSSREEVLQLVKELIEKDFPNFHLCITSRSEPDIQTILAPLAFCSMSLHDQDGQKQDIIDYIRSVVNLDPKTQRWRNEDKELVIDVLSRRADGMFRWVFCQLDFLRGCLPGRIRRALDELPNTLDATYERTLQDIDEANWEYAHRLFQFVTVASRPLRVEELAEFLAFDLTTGSLPDFLPGCRLEDSHNAVLSTCSSLLAVVNVDGSPVVQFSHFSVKEFLMSRRLDRARDTISRYRVLLEPSHIFVAQACLAILLHWGPNVDEVTVKKLPLANYAAQHWVDHARYEMVSLNLQDGIKLLLDSSRPHFAIWAWITDSIFHLPLSRVFQNASVLVKTPVNHDALFGLQETDILAIKRSQLVNPWLQLERGADPNFHIKNSTPLFWALHIRSLRVARVLLEHGADANIRDDHNRSQLHWASLYEHLEVARVLLEYGADANAKDVLNQTPLHWAFRHGNLELTRLLLQHGADANIRDNHNRTRLHQASREGDLEVALVLLEWGADANAQDDRKSTPLHLASQEGRLEGAQVLLQHGANANILDDHNRTPLHWSFLSGNLELTRLLLQHGADANVGDERHRTPLHWASIRGHLEVTLILIQHGADANVRDDRNRTPLHWASLFQHVEVARVLLEHGAAANAGDYTIRTPLHEASQSGHVELVRLLLHHDANIHVRDNNEWTPFQGASASGHHGVMQLLSEHGNIEHRA